MRGQHTMKFAAAIELPHLQHGSHKLHHVLAGKLVAVGKLHHAAVLVIAGQRHAARGERFATGLGVALNLILKIKPALKSFKKS